MAPVVVAWTAIVAFGVVKLMAFDASPARAAATTNPTSGSGTSDEAKRRSGEHYTLILCVHPLCPCSLASVAELGRLLADDAQGRLHAQVLFVIPQGLDFDPHEASLWKAAAALPHTDVSIDELGSKARALGALTSGQAFLFDASNVLRFSGGLTPARGKVGDVAVKDAIWQIVRGHTRTAVIHSPVFGCSLD